MITTRCQLCDSKRLDQIIDLGDHPLADTFYPDEKSAREANTYPLRVMQCSDCGYTTLYSIVPAEERYQRVDYSYTSSNSAVAVKHFNEMARQGVEKAQATDKDLVVDIGSNDGTLLAAFKAAADCHVLGFEPARNIARIALERGIPTINDFFTATAIEGAIITYGKAKIITATNVFNHITDLTGFMKNISTFLTDDGIFIFETPYLLHLVQQHAFDTIYLEHVSYFGLKPFNAFFKRFGLSISHHEENDYMGGSIRVYLTKEGDESSDLGAMIAKEEKAGIYEKATYARFMQAIEGLRKDLLGKIRSVKKQDGKIIGIGAATKGNTLLNYCRIDSSLLEFITDATPLKIGKYTPGSHIQIKSDTDITPDITHALILPWNIGNFLKEKLKHLRLEFIIPAIKK